MDTHTHTHRHVDVREFLRDALENAVVDRTQTDVCRRWLDNSNRFVFGTFSSVFAFLTIAHPAAALPAYILSPRLLVRIHRVDVYVHRSSFFPPPYLTRPPPSRFPSRFRYYGGEAAAETKLQGFDVARV